MRAAAQKGVILMKKIYAAFTSLVAVVSALAFATPASQAAHQHTSTSHVRRRAAKVRKRVKQQAVRYVCPMHPDMRSHSKGECPKCGMQLVAERQGTKS